MRELYLTHALRRAVFGAQTYGLRSRFLDEIPAELLDEAQAPRRGLEPSLPGRSRARLASSAASGPELAPQPSAWTSWRAGDAPPTVHFRLGEDVVHAAFGEGVVTGVEPDGVIVVRFAGDGSERKLMAEYAPVSRR